MAPACGPRLAAGIALAILAAGGGPSASWHEIGGPAAPKPATGPEVRDPFFALVLALGDADSLVAWSGAEVRAALAAGGPPSRLPVTGLDSLVRRRPRPPERAAWAGSDLRAIWEVVLPEPVDAPMPYAVLGYHPGSVRCAARLVLGEVVLPDHTVPGGGDGGPAWVAASEVRVHPLLAGHVVLDVDGLPDALLGSLVDDSWTLAFVSARLGGERVGIATSVGRDGRPIFGEFDFRADRIILDGRPEAAALSREARALVASRRRGLPAPWSAP